MRRDRPAGEQLRPSGGIVTAVEPIPRRRKRVRVYVDGTVVLELDALVAAELGLVVGRSVETALLIDAAARDEVRRAGAAAVRLLAIRARTRAELAERLKRNGYSEIAVAGALAHLERQGWVDDEAFARNYVRARLESSDPPGQRRLRQELGRRGVPAQLVDEALAACQDVDPVAMAAVIARKRLERIGSMDRAVAYRRLASYLGRRGYEAQVIAVTLRTLLGEWENPGEEIGAAECESGERNRTGTQRGLFRRRWS